MSECVPVIQGIQYVTYEEAEAIIDNKEPRGLFYTLESRMFTGIRNIDGHPEVLAHRTKDACFKWLNTGKE